MSIGKNEELYLECPMCDAEIPISGEEKIGTEVQCPYCETPLKLKKNKKDDILYFQEDF